MRTVAGVLHAFGRRRHGSKINPCGFRHGAGHTLSAVAGGKLKGPIGPMKLVTSTFHPSSSTAALRFLMPSGFFTMSSLHGTTRVLRAIGGGPRLTGRYGSLTGRIRTTLGGCTICGRPGCNGVCTFRMSKFNGRLLVSSTGIPDLVTVPCLKSIGMGSPVCRGAHHFI